MTKDIPEHFDWVSARARCSPWTAMETLRGQIQGDMNARNALGSEQGFPRRNFEFTSQDGWFAVIWNSVHTDNLRGVRFVKDEVGIQVLSVPDHRILHESVLTISDAGSCRLRVNGDELTFWQFRKLALYDLFFVYKELAQ